MQARDFDLPDLTAPNETVAIFSDYGGEHSSSAYVSYSFLFMAYSYRDVLRDELANLRQRHGLNAPPTEIAFKQLRYGPVERILPSYLKALDTLIAGWLVTIVVDKSISTLMGIGGRDAYDYISQILEDAGVGG